MVDTRNKAILSTGIGKLHFFESVLALHKIGYPVEIITGWRPKTDNHLVNLVGKLIAQDNLTNRLAARRPVGLESVTVHSCTEAEAYAHALQILVKFRLLSPSDSSVLGFESFGKASKKYLHGAGIFHVRSGAGQGGAISKARSQGMKIIVDQSIAHPSVMAANLRSEFAKFNLPLSFRPDDKFWQLVLLDCAEADLLLVNSDYVKDTFIDTGYPADKISVAYWGVRPDFWNLKQDYQRGTEIRLLFTGHFDLRKGARVILESLDILQSKGISCRLDVVGFVSSGKYALDQFNHLKNIYFHGFIPQEELKQFFKSADLFVFPTFAEGSSRSAMEAMGAGLPVITTQNCGVPIEHGINGWYVPVGNSDTLAEAIEILGNDEQKREQIGMNAHNTISSKYTWNNYANCVVDIYSKIAS
jgi:glycosyltransferase involved in cell wall biosynthesis